MSHSSAKRLAGHGRGPDSTLVHMSHREVAGLDALARRHYGRGLSLNPKTGLPEAGVLDDLLPAIAGAGLTYFTGMSPGMAALTVGGGAALASGSLEQGLLAGLGAYGGAGLGASMAGGATAGASSAAAAPAAQFTTGQQALPTMPDMSGMETVSPGFDDYSQYANMETVSPGFDPIDARMDQMGVMDIETVSPGFDDMAPSAMGGTTGDFARMDRLAGIADPASVAAQGGGLGGLFAKGNLGNWAMAAAPLLGNKLLGDRDKGSPMEDPNDRAMIRPYRYDQNVPGGMGYTALAPIRARDFRGFAGGGITGLLKGPGDGVSDSIPATVEGHEPAALGDGEYVMPARVVSALGNGSTSAGAARLDQMVQRVMRANGRANSKKNVAVDIKPDKLLAA